MTDSAGSLKSVSHQMLADMRSALNSYAKSSKDANDEAEEKKVNTERNQITRRALSDIKSNFTRINRTEEDVQDAENKIRQDAANTTIQTVKTELRQTDALKNIKTEIKKYTLPKNSSTIITELKRNGMHRTMSPYQIADEYGLSYIQAKDILDKVNTDSNGFVREYVFPEYSTVSFKV